jgi:cytoskeletal protein RodZ
MKTTKVSSPLRRLQPYFSTLIFVLMLTLVLIMLSACGAGKTTTTSSASNTTTSTRQTPTGSTTATSAAVTTANTGATSGGSAIGSSESGSPGSPTTTTNGTLPSATTSEITPTTSDAVDIPQLAFIVSVSTNTPVTVQADYVEIYFDAEAVALAQQDNYPLLEKDEAGEYYLPNDYYLRNNNTKLRSLTLSPDCLIEVLPPEGGAEATEVITAAELRGFVEVEKRLMELHFDKSGTRLIGLTEYFLP